MANKDFQSMHGPRHILIHESLSRLLDPRLWE